MLWFKEHWIRCLEVILLIIFFLFGWFLRDYIVIDKNNFNYFSYIASIVTIYALIVSFLEISNGLYRSRTLIQESRKIHEDNRAYAIGVFSNEIVNIIEDIDHYLVEDNYFSAKACLKAFSRNFYKIPGELSDKECNKNVVDGIHDFVNSWYRAANYDKIPQGEKNSVLRDLRNLKKEINEYIRMHNEKVK